MTKPPWNPTSSRDLDVRRASRNRLQRAERSALGREPYTCPHCHRTLPATTIRGSDRHACTDPRCRGSAWGTTARERWLETRRARCLDNPTLATRSSDLSPALVRAIRDYPAGRRRTAEAFAVDPGTVGRIRSGRSYAWVPLERPESDQPKETP